MSSQDDDDQGRVVAFVLTGALVLTLGLALGVGIQAARGTGARAGAPAAAGQAAPAPQATPALQAVPVAAAPQADDASVVVDNGVVKFYFASGKADLAPGALDALGEAVSAAKAGKKLVVSGFHDTTGDPSKNAELAKQRAFAVRDALKGAGVAESSLELKKPEQAAGDAGGTHANAQARRVEVTIAP